MPKDKNTVKQEQTANLTETTASLSKRGEEQLGFLKGKVNERSTVSSGKQHKNSKLEGKQTRTETAATQMISLVTVSHLPEGSVLYSNFKRAWGRVLRSALEVRITAMGGTVTAAPCFCF